MPAIRDLPTDLPPHRYRNSRHCKVCWRFYWRAYRVFHPRRKKDGQ